MFGVLKTLSDGSVFAVAIVETKENTFMHSEAIDLLNMGARVAAEKALQYDEEGKTRDAVAQRYLKVKYLNAVAALVSARPAREHTEKDFAGDKDRRVSKPIKRY